jgi:hypothetical protein
MLLGSEAVQRLWSACCAGLEEQFLVSLEDLEALVPTVQAPVGPVPTQVGAVAAFSSS